MSDANTSILARRWPRFGAVMAMFTFLGLIDAVQFYMHVKHFFSNALHWEEAVAVGLADWYLWAALLPIVFYLARRFRLDTGHWFSRLLIHVYFGAIVVLVKIALDLFIDFAVIGKEFMILPLSQEERELPNFEYLLPLYKTFVFGKIYIYPVIYALMVGASHFWDHHRRFRAREIEASRLEAQLAHAQLQTLRMQLQPHFLFNTLNAIAALMHRDVRLADHMIARLGQLLRASLENPATQECTLRHELSLLRPYLDIEQTRLGPRLTVTIEAASELLDAQLPYLLIQPLVENAIRHGIAPKIGPGRLSVEIRRDGDRLVIEVADNGVGFRDNARAGEGIGLANTRARLRGLYGDAASFSLGAGPEGGVVATVTLPYRELPPPAESDAAEIPSRTAFAGNDQTSLGTRKAHDETASARR